MGRASEKHQSHAGDLHHEASLTRHLKMISSSTGVPSGRAGDAVHQATGALVLSEDVLQQLGCGIGGLSADLIVDRFRPGHRVAAMRRRRSTSASSETLT